MRWQWGRVRLWTRPGGKPDSRPLDDFICFVKWRRRFWICRTLLMAIAVSAVVGTVPVSAHEKQQVTSADSC